MGNNTQTNVDSGKPRRLGRGLSALIGQPVQVAAPAAPATRAAVSSAAVPAVAEAPGASAVQGEAVVMLRTELMQPGKYQPRRVFDEQQLKELAASMKAAGVVQPVVVRPVAGSGGTGGGGEKYELIAGERRWRAARLAGMATIPALIKRVSDEQAAEWSLIENLQRADLRPLERAEALANLCGTFRLSHQQAAERIGMERSSVANLIRLLELEEPIRALLDEGKLSGGHGKALLAAPPGQARVNLASIAAAQGWSVRKLEQAAGNAQVPGVGAAPVAIAASDKAVARAAALRDLEKQLGEHLGTAVNIRASSSGKRGSIVLKFYDLDHFDGLMSKMGFRLR